MLSCLTKFWVYIVAFTILSLFLTTVHLMFNETFVERHLEPLFAINSSDATVLVQVDSNLTSSWNARQSRHRYHRNEVLEPYYMERNVTKFCPKVPPKLEGKVQLVKEAAPSFQDLVNEFRNSSLQADGRFQPANCIARFVVAIVVPYRGRFEHLNIFLRNIHPFVQRHQVDYTIFIVEQAGDGPFNRGMLMNVGFVEAMKIRPFDCFIFHDVDLLPENDRNIYSCPDQPRHMSVAVDIFRYKLPYRDIFGGISAMSAEHFQLVNGYSNMFWGWGGEDDDMSMRIRMKGLHLLRYPPSIARYTMLPHEKQKANPNRFEKLYLGRKRFKNEGLNSLEYRRISIRPCKLFTWIFVELTPPHQENILITIIKNSYFVRVLADLIPWSE